MLTKIKLFYYLGRFNSPFGYMLLMLPSLWGLTLNLYLSPQKFSILYIIYLYAIFAVGSIIMRAWGCVINDVFDSNIDAKVGRTKNRPLASKLLTKSDALIFLIVLSIIPIIILLSLPNYAKIIALGVLPIVIIYPLSKRFFKIPQLILGLAFNWGIVLSSAIIFGYINTESIILYVASILWTLCYDGIYAYQDYIDDKKLGLNSIAILMQERAKIILGLCYIAMGLLTIFLGLYKNFNEFYYIMQFFAYMYILINFFKLDYKNTQMCFKFFKQNVYFAIIILLSFGALYV